MQSTTIAEHSSQVWGEHTQVATTMGIQHAPTPSKLYGFPIRDEEKAGGRAVEAVAKTVLGAHGDPQKGQLSICLCSDYDKDFTLVGAIVLQGGGMASQRDNLGDSAWAGRLLTSG